MKILIVDDDPKRAERISKWLEDNVVNPGNVFHAICTNEARLLMRNNFFEILILDVVLPNRNDDPATARKGIDLLHQISRSPYIRTPERIVGITSYIDDINNFKKEFEKFCFTVVEVRADSDEWHPAFRNIIQHSQGSKIARQTEGARVAAITIHGIRTFGGWQNRLKDIVSKNTSLVDFHSYKYGYYSAIFFLIPWARNKEVSRLQDKLNNLADKFDDSELIIFAHSFGTYLIAHALSELSEKPSKIRLKKLVLSGSVLPSRFDWSFLDRFGNVSVVNDCGTNDYILWMSEAFVPYAGMAGKSGFYGFNNNQLSNRFFDGGHSLYFTKEKFMERYWLPLFFEDEPGMIDQRNNSLVLDGIIEQIVVVLGKIKGVTWTILLVFLAGAIFLK